MFSRSLPFHWGSVEVGSGVPSGGALVVPGVLVSSGLASALDRRRLGVSVESQLAAVPFGSKMQLSVPCASAPLTATKPWPPAMTRQTASRPASDSGSSLRLGRPSRPSPDASTALR